MDVKLNNEKEYKKCIDSPYYFYTTYWKLNGETGKTKYSEEEFNNIFKQMSECKPIKLYSIKR